MWYFSVVACIKTWYCTVAGTSWQAGKARQAGITYYCTYSYKSIRSSIFKRSKVKSQKVLGVPYTKYPVSRYVGILGLFIVPRSTVRFRSERLHHRSEEYFVL